MGCDIHLTLEKRRRKEKVIPLTDKKNITLKREWEWCDIFNRYDFYTWSDRVYGMFAALANVRNYEYYGIKGLEDRGIPDDACIYTLRRYADKVIPDNEYEQKEKDNIAEGYVSKSDADEYIKRGLSRIIKYENKNTPYYNGDYCTCPDWHSASWCTTKEMEEAFNQVFLKKDGSINFDSDYIEWQALLYAMKGYEASGEYECRAVFWFDN